VVTLLCVDLWEVRRSPYGLMYVVGVPMLALLAGSFLHGVIRAASDIQLAKNMGISAGLCPLCQYPIMQSRCSECGWGYTSSVGNSERRYRTAIIVMIVIALSASIILSFAQTVSGWARTWYHPSAYLVPRPGIAYVMKLSCGIAVVSQSVADPISGQSSCDVYFKGVDGTTWLPIGNAQSSAWMVGERRSLQWTGDGPWIARTVLWGGYPVIRIDGRIKRLELLSRQEFETILGHPRSGLGSSAP
jgi:hypothetical protein